MISFYISNFWATVQPSLEHFVEGLHSRVNCFRRNSGNVIESTCILRALTNLFGVVYISNDKGHGN